MDAHVSALSLFLVTPHGQPMNSIRTMLLVALLSLTGCSQCGEAVTPFDTEDQIDGGADAGDAAVGSEDAAVGSEDGGPVDDTGSADMRPDPCPNAFSGGACDAGDEGTVCNYTCDGTCGWCSGIQCSGGVWSSIEDAPPTFCGRECHPTDDPCDDATYSSCEYVEDLGDFRCFEPGEESIGEPCTPSITGQFDVECGDGLHCVDESGGVCARTCDPNDQSPVNCPYGCKPASDFGIDDPDLGFCLVPSGGTCVDETDLPQGECDVFAQDCPDGEFCDVVVTSTSPLRFEGMCRSDTDEHTLGEKEACDSTVGEDCAPGLKCHEPSETCHFVCRLSDGFGCSAGKVCRDVVGDGFGLCGTSCE